MAKESSFTVTECQTLQRAVADTMAYISIADPGFWDMFKEASGAARYMAGVKASSESALVRDLAGDIHAKRDKAVSGDPTDVSGEVIARVNEAVKIVSDKAPEDLVPSRASSSVSPRRPPRPSRAPARPRLRLSRSWRTRWPSGSGVRPARQLEQRAPTFAKSISGSIGFSTNSLTGSHESSLSLLENLPT
jgi:hypothetical protein